MPITKPFSLSAMVDSDGDGNDSDTGVVSPQELNKENTRGGPGKRGPKSKASTKHFTKPKRKSTESVAPAKEDTKKPRIGKKKTPLVEREPNEVDGADEEEDEIAQLTSVAISKEPKPPKKGTKRKLEEAPQERAAKTRPTKQTSIQKSDGEFQFTPTQGGRSKRDAAIKPVKSRANDKVTHYEAPEIPETQTNIDSDPSLGAEDESVPVSTFQASSRRTFGTAQASIHHQSAPVRRVPESPSNADSGKGDPALRRKLGEMTRKYDNISLQYRNLRDVGIKEAEVNYEKLRKQTEVNRKAAADLIESLKNEISTQKAIAQETHDLRSELHGREADLTKARKATDELSKALLEAQNENKVLQAKLSSSRGASVQAEKTPGSAMRSRAQSQVKPNLTTSLDSGTAQLKDDLYSDLTGLILRGVDVEPDADIFDCIQTGRNGTLHFKLAVTKDPDEAYEDVEFQYTPRLDSSRDRALIELLPEYLTEEITFSRMNAAPFYARIMETLMKKRMVEPVE